MNFEICTIAKALHFLDHQLMYQSLTKIASSSPAWYYNAYHDSAIGSKIQVQKNNKISKRVLKQ